MYLRTVGGIALATVFLLPPRIQAQASHPQESVVRPVLVEAADEIRTELGLTDAQAREFRFLIVERAIRAEAVAASFGHVTFDSVIDLLAEARSIKQEFIPQLNALLTPQQRARLANLPRQRQLWSTVAAASMAEARLKSLDARVNLTPDQVPAVRTQLLAEFHDAADIVDELLRADNGRRPAAGAVLDAVLDLRAAVRAGTRKVEQMLTPEQRAALEAHRHDSGSSQSGRDRQPSR
jgi:Spy/CpxP family protein refolding chaperone